MWSPTAGSVVESFTAPDGAHDADPAVVPGTLIGMGTEWWIVIGVVVLLFGGTQLPKLARSIGQAQKEFKKGLSEGAAAEDGDTDKKPSA
jgi:sec-independent protein translocase protein TatA